MMLPDPDRAHVERTKIVAYLLSASHPDGSAKAAFFRRFGFHVDRWAILAEALKDVGVSNPVTSKMESAYGTRYTVDGLLPTPDGRTPMVRTVWVIESGDPPRLITAYPL